ncbi:glycosyltransferase family 39 protein [bacterium]|nr:glycosyltransferase family 39 protein [candidate division CSSED10-310 bacterium]
MKQVIRGDRSVWFVLWCLAVVLRALHPLADPPPDLSWSGGYCADEGFWTHDARNLILFGSYGKDDWHDRFVAPLVHWSVYGVFRVLSPSLAGVRIWAQLVSFFALICLAVLLRRYRWGVLAFLMLAICSLLVAYQRLALLETAAILGCSAALLFWDTAIQRRYILLDLGVGALAASTLITKSTQVHFVAAIFLAGLILSEKSGRLRRMVMQGIGFMAVISVWYVRIRIPNRMLLDQYQSYYAFQQGETVFELIKNILLQPVFIYLNRMPLIFMTAWLVIAERIVLRKRSSGIPPVIDFCIIWLVSGLMFFAPFGYRPLRYYVPLIVPAILVAAWRLDRFIHDSVKAGGSAAGVNFRHLAAVAFWILIPVGINGAVLLDALVFSGRYLKFQNVPGLSLVGCAMVVITGLVLTAVVLGKMRLKPVHLLLAVSFFMALHAGRLTLWQIERTYSVLEASRYIGRMVPEDSVIAGQWAPELCLENRCTAVPMWKDFVNYRDPFHRLGITHVLSWQYPPGDELQLQRIWFPEEMRQLQRLTVFNIKKSPVVFWEVSAE